MTHKITLPDGTIIEIFTNADEVGQTDLDVQALWHEAEQKAQSKMKLDEPKTGKTETTLGGNMEKQAETTKFLLNELESLKARVQAIENQYAQADQIWTPHDIAAYAKVSYGYVIQTLIKLPGFPTTLGDSRPRSPKKYRAVDVIEFFKNRNKA